MDTKQLALRWFEEVWNHKNPDIIDEMMDPSAEGVTEGGVVRGPEGFRKLVFEPLVAAFPDIQVTIDEIVAEGDVAALRWTAVAGHHGPFGPVDASGRRVQFSGMTFLTFRRGRIVGGSDSYNLHGLASYLAEGAECASVRAAAEQAVRA